MDTSLTAEQKIRQTLTGNPASDPSFQHEGGSVVRWLTGGTMPDAWVTLHHTEEGDQVLVRCAGCHEPLGRWSLHDDTQAEQIAAIRQTGHEGHKPEGWPRP